MCREMYALLNTCRSVKSIRSGYECRARNTRSAFKNGNDIRYLISLRVCVIRVQYFVIDLLRKKIESSKFFDIFDFEKKRKRKITNTNNGTTKLNKANNNLAYSNQFLGYKF